MDALVLDAGLLEEDGAGGAVGGGAFEAGAVVAFVAFASVGGSGGAAFGVVGAQVVEAAGVGIVVNCLFSLNF